MRVAVTGLGVVSAIGNDKESFWESLVRAGGEVAGTADHQQPPGEGDLKIACVDPGDVDPY